MSTDALNDNAAPPPDDEILAGEYVLGVLDEISRRRTATRLRSDTGFAGLVERWERRFAPWLLRAPAVPPSPQIWERIRERLEWTSEKRGPRGVWDNAAFWRSAAALVFVAGVIAVVFGLMRTPLAPDRFAASPVTVLARGDGTPGWIARIDAERGELLMVPVPGAADATGRVNELWIIPEGGKPLSLGMISHEKALTVSVPPELRANLVVGATLAITLEDQAGIPHAAPSSQPIAVGNIRTI